jgi:hypothetical protein
MQTDAIDVRGSAPICVGARKWATWFGFGPLRGSGIPSSLGRNGVLSPSNRLSRWQTESSMKIIVSAEKSGQQIGRSEFEVEAGDDPDRRTSKALKQFRKEHRDISLFNNEVRIKFDKAQ